MWDEVIECYQIREQPHKALEVVSDRLKIEESPKLLCLLGDLTNKEEHYLKAWEVSGRRYTRAKRSLGLMAFNSGKVCLILYSHSCSSQYKEAAVHLQEALAINPQFGSSWFRLGVVGLRLPDLPLAQRAFSRVVQLHPEDGEAWNNLGSVFLKMNKKYHSYSISNWIPIPLI